METIDFLKTHPATLSWWERRPLCESCANGRILTSVTLRDGNLGFRCNALRNRDISPVLKKLHNIKSIGAPDDRAYCIDARTEGSPCGPEGKLFTPREKAIKQLGEEA